MSVTRRTRIPRWAVTTAVAMALASGSYLWKVTEYGAVRSLEAEAATLEASGESSQRPIQRDAPATDFAMKLEQHAPVDAIVRDLQRFASSAGAQFVSVDATPREPTPQSLGRIEINAALRGEYPKIKMAVGDLLDRYPNLIVQRLSMRRTSSPTDLEATVGIILLTRPAPERDAAPRKTGT